MLVSNPDEKAAVRPAGNCRRDVAAGYRRRHPDHGLPRRDAHDDHDRRRSAGRHRREDGARARNRRQRDDLDRHRPQSGPKRRLERPARRDRRSILGRKSNHAPDATVRQPARRWCSSLVAVIALAGAFALATLVQQNVPNIDFPAVTVSASYPGAPPSELRDAVVRPLEDAIAGAPDLDHINTSIQQNQATISAIFTLDSNQTTDLTEVQDRVQTARGALPSDLPAPTVRTFDPAQANDRDALGHVALADASPASRRSSPTTSSRRSSKCDGVSNVTANGTVTPAHRGDGRSAEAVRLRLHRQRRRERDPIEQRARAGRHRLRGRTARRRSTCAATCKRRRRSRTCCSPASTGGAARARPRRPGTVTQKYTGTSGSTNQALPLSDAAASGAAGAATNPFSTQARLPRIGDVATVTDGYEPKRVYSYVDGMPAISLNVLKAAGASEVTASHAVAGRAARRSKRSSPTSHSGCSTSRPTSPNSNCSASMYTLARRHRVHRHRDAVLPALVAQRARRDGRDPDLAVRHRCS